MDREDQIRIFCSEERPGEAARKYWGDDFDQIRITSPLNVCREEGYEQIGTVSDGDHEYAVFGKND